MMLPLPNLFLVRNKGEIISLAEVLGAKRLSDHSVWAGGFHNSLAHYAGDHLGSHQSGLRIYPLLACVCVFIDTKDQNV